jgi:hypothetical protein
MRLLAAELTRFVTRRAVLVVLLAATVLVILVVGSAAYNTRPPDATERAAAEQMLTRETQVDETDYAECAKDPEAYFGGLVDAGGCESLRPTLQWYLPRPTLDIATEVDDRGPVVVVLLTGMAVLVGAFFAGRDWTTGSMSTQLLNEPRRLRLWLAKALAVMLGATAAAAVLLALFWGVLAVIATLRDLSPAAESWRLVAETSGRALALVAAVAVGSFALTMALRHTVVTLGLLFAYAVVGEGLAASLPFEKMSQWSIANNVLAWVRNGFDVHDRSLCADVTGPCASTYQLSLQHGAIYLGALLLLAVVVSLLTFRRRDVP